MNRWLIVLVVFLCGSSALAAPMSVEGRKLLSHYGWICGKDTVEMTFSLPESLEEEPEAFYQRASRAIGYDLTPGKGHDIAMVRYTLTRRSELTRSPLYGHVAFFKSRIIGAWLSTDAPIAPAIVPLDEDSFGKGF